MLLINRLSRFEETPRLGGGHGLQRLLPLLPVQLLQLLPEAGAGRLSRQLGAGLARVVGQVQGGRVPVVEDCCQLRLARGTSPHLRTQM